MSWYNAVDLDKNKKQRKSADMFTHISKKKNHTSITRIRNRYNEVIELTQCDDSRKKKRQPKSADMFTHISNKKNTH